MKSGKKKKLLIIGCGKTDASKIKKILAGEGWNIINNILFDDIKKINFDNRPDAILIDIKNYDKKTCASAERIGRQYSVPVIFLISKNKIKNLKSLPPFKYVLKPPAERELKLVLEAAVAGGRKPENNRTAANGDLKDILSSINDFVFVLDRDGKFTFVNHPDSPDLYIKAEHFIGKNTGALLPPHVVEKFAEAFNQNKKNKTAFYEYSLKVKGRDEYFSARQSPLLNAGKFNGAVAVISKITEQRKIESGLKESEKKHRMLVENLQEGIWMIDRDAFTTYVNPRMADMLGFTQNEMMGKHLFDFTDGQARQIAEKKIERRRQGIKEVHDFEFIRKDGTRIYTLLSTYPLTDDLGEYDGALAAVSDITERRQAESQREAALEALRESENRFQTIYNRSPVGIYIHDFSGNFFDANDYILGLLGYSRDEISGINFGHLIDEEQARKAIESIDVILRDGYEKSPIQFKVKRKDGGFIWIEVMGSLLTRGGRPYAIQGIARDITESKMSEKTLIGSAQKFARAFDLNPYPMAISSIKDGKYLEINSSFTGTIGFTKDESIGRTAAELGIWANSDDRARILDIIKENGRIHEFQFEFFNKKREKRTGLFSGEIFESFGEKLFITLVRDITERRWFEDIMIGQRDLAISLGSSFTVEEIFNSCGGLLEKISGMDSCGLYSFNESKKKWSLVFHRGLSGEFAREITEYPESSYNSRVMMEGMPVYTRYSDFLKEDNEIKRKEGLKSFAVIPVRREGKVIACLNVASHVHDEVPFEVRSILETFAAQIGNAIARLEAENALRDSEKRIRTILESSPDAIIVTDLKGTVTTCNHAALEMYGYLKEGSMIGIASIELVSPKDRALWTECLQEIIEKAQIKNIECVFLKCGGGEFFCDLSMGLLHGSDGGHAGIVSIITDITSRKKMEDEIRQSLHEKDVLLREINHRVKNNMQIISSVLTMQARRINDETARNKFQESVNRIYSMALVHELLYQSENMTKINIKSYISMLSTNLLNTYNLNINQVALKTDIDKKIELDINKAIPCGLLLNELITNAFKYAFPEGRKGTVSIKFSRLKNNSLKFEVWDDGIGIDDSVDLNNSQTLGMQIVNALVNQLNGILQIERKNGLRFTLTFRR